MTREGFECQCGEYHKYPGYVFAHWDLRLTFTCKHCKRKYLILKGLATKQKDALAADIETNKKERGE